MPKQILTEEEKLARKEERNNLRRERYALIDKDELKLKRREKYIKNKESILASNKSWRLANVEKVRESSKIKGKNYRINNPEKYKESIKKTTDRYREFFPYMLSIKQIKHRAKKKGLEFDLTNNWAKDRWTGRCEITGILFDIGGKRKTTAGPFSPSIDKINPALGYIQSNCRFILMCVNAFKHVMNDQQMAEIAKLIVANIPVIEKPINTE